MIPPNHPSELNILRFKLSRRSESHLAEVHQDLVAVIELALQKSKVDFAVIDGLRTNEQQAELVKNGKSKTMHSRHLTGHAVDLAPYQEGKISWEPHSFLPIAEAVRESANDRDTPVVWGGCWRVINAIENLDQAIDSYRAGKEAAGEKPFLDYGHFELSREKYPGIIRDSKSNSNQIQKSELSSAIGETAPRKNISDGSRFAQDIGYSRAVVAGDWVFISGTTGFDYQTMTISKEPREQCRQCCQNISEALHGAGAGFDDIVRLGYIFRSRQDFSACWPILKKTVGRSRPAATMFLAELYDPRMLLEIEVTARIGLSK